MLTARLGVVLWGSSCLGLGERNQQDTGVCWKGRYRFGEVGRYYSQGSQAFRVNGDGGLSFELNLLASKAKARPVTD